MNALVLRHAGLAAQAVLDVLFPRVECCSCGEERLLDNGLCGVCKETMVPHGARENHALLTGLFAAYRYGGAAREMVHRLKFDGQRDVARFMADAMLPFMPASDAFLVPVPIHSSRRRERGFNQSDDIARHIFLQGGPPVLRDGLIRTRATRPQTELSGDERRANMRHAFVANKRRVNGRHLVLIDDVYTTGTTLSACAQELFSAGALRVYALTFAKTAFDDEEMTRNG